ncbi:FixH family protein [Alkalihalobacillus trypoxylicola]|uniref:YtkA-like domain-containing protein n=1 Tax=Alkalihalobacillus trypoxylicola TaxID=519424 RepID=A0A161PJ91_9BACI|nr:FixH family protein [Alkalihalobacillus trypoxylicola]KYG29351.1 hypothetical protein AZF04_07445 [Alkalihalobacillus trypoxylicola]GAF64446.1 hypothetical protein BTS2_1339 [Bacillus sp. TS-2]
MKRFSFLLLLSISLLMACSNSDEQTTQPDSLVPVEVSIQLPNESLDINEEITLGAVVTHGEEVVEDAYEVIFEVWESGNKEDSEMIEAEHVGSGLYENTYSFTNEGLYNVQAHVTARDMHVMPTKEFTVGSLTEEELAEMYPDNEESDASHENHEGDTEEHDEDDHEHHH